MTSNPFAVPEHALTAWEHLHAEILATGPTPCAGPDRDDWTGAAAQQDRAAERCWDCPVLDACAHYALTASEADGVWGGMSATERQKRGAA